MVFIILRLQLIEGHADDSVTEPSKMGKMESATVENVHGHSSVSFLPFLL